jgi:hypothetical protein
LAAPVGTQPPTSQASAAESSQAVTAPLALPMAAPASTAPTALQPTRRAAAGLVEEGASILG